MINSNNIYKLIKKAKEENLITSNPISKIIQHPITFIYSFTLNAQNEPIFEEQLEIPFKAKNNKENQIKNRKDENIKTNIFKGESIKNNGINEIKKSNFDKSKKANEKQNIFLNKKRNIEKNQNKEIHYAESYNKSPKVVKNKIIHQIYNSNNINLWENESDEEKNENILPIHKQIEFVDKCKNEFSKHNVEKKSDYDKDLDKGRIKKIHKNKIGFKKHKNYFQKISNKQLKNQIKFSNNNNF